VPVSCPDAAASGVIEAVGSAAGAVAVPVDAGAVADRVAVADGGDAAADVEEPLEAEHPVSVTITPATAASAAMAGGAPRTTNDDTALPTPDVDPTPDNVPVLVAAPGAH
jgi:membrane peptidoglycan carboxypeptidase